MAPTREQDAQSRLDEFCALTQCSQEQALFYIEASNGQFDQAVAMYYDHEQRGLGSSSQQHQTHQADTAPPQTANRETGATSSSTRQPTNEHHAQNVPALVVTQGIGVVLGTFKFAASLVGALGSRVLPARWIHGIKARLRWLFQGHSLAPNEAAQLFVRQFESAFGELHPRWEVTDWQSATQRAHGQFKFLFVYLHSPRHQDTDLYCQGTLSDANLVEYVNTNFVSWAGDVTQPNAFQLSQGLRISAYPYVCLLAYSGSRTRLIAAVEGYMDPQTLLPILQQAQDSQSIHLIAEQADHNERATNRILREEQDAEYQRSLQADREREQKRKEASEAAEQEKRKVLEAAEKQRQEREAAEKRIADKAASLRSRQETKAANLKAQPDASSGEPIAQVRVRLPDGSQHSHKFLARSPLQDVYDFVDSLQSLQVWDYSLVSSYPRKVLGKTEAQKSIDELGLAPQAVLFVQSEDD